VVLPLVIGTYGMEEIKEASKGGFLYSVSGTVFSVNNMNLENIIDYLALVSNINEWFIHHTRTDLLLATCTLFYPMHLTATLFTSLTAPIVSMGELDIKVLSSQSFIEVGRYSLFMFTGMDFETNTSALLNLLSYLI
jgi:hypothetical protein